ncbi:hypothetical protein BGM26_08945 [Bacillus sp. FJAT-29790]|nr:hypothetical protein [Bacillus sp. FJAT-29790]
MEGLTFYWVAWTFWIIATFFMKRSEASRIKLSLWLLLIIILSPHVISVFGMKISVAGLFLAGTLFMFTAKLERLKAVYFILCSFIIMLAYVCFLLFELFDPVWLVFPRNGMLAFLLVFLTVMLQENRLNRILIVLLGSIQGDLLYALILSKYSFPYLVGSFAFFDAAALSTIMLTIWNGVEFLAAYYEKHYNQIEREKQKLS